MTKENANIASPMGLMVEVLVIKLAILITVVQFCAGVCEKKFDPTFKSVKDIHDAIANCPGTTCQSIITSYLNRINRLDQQGPKLNALIQVNPAAIEISKQLDAIAIDKRG